MKYYIFLLAILATAPVSATTWDEPWHEQVVQQSTSFARIKVLQGGEDSVEVQLVRWLSGEKVDSTFWITDFFALNLTSYSSGHGPEFYYFKTGIEAYVFLRQDTGRYAIATPTTGFAMVRQEGVNATYRHSYHQALVPERVYERTMIAIFEHAHGHAYDTAFVRHYADSVLALSPASLEQADSDLFFAQHVALETLYHLDLDGYFAKIRPFLLDADNWHNRISAARALASCHSDAAIQLLLGRIGGKEKEPFVQMICAKSLTRLKPVAYKKEVEKLARKVDSEYLSFGGNIMDPRVGTSVPSVKTAMEDLLDTL